MTGSAPRSKEKHLHLVRTYIHMFIHKSIYLQELAWPQPVLATPGGDFAHKAGYPEQAGCCSAPTKPGSKRESAVLNSAKHQVEVSCVIFISLPCPFIGGTYVFMYVCMYILVHTYMHTYIHAE